MHIRECNARVGQALRGFIWLHLSRCGFPSAGARAQFFRGAITRSRLFLRGAMALSLSLGDAARRMKSGEKEGPLDKEKSRGAGRIIASECTGELRDAPGRF